MYKFVCDPEALFNMAYGGSAAMSIDAVHGNGGGGGGASSMVNVNCREISAALPANVLSDASSVQQLAATQHYYSGGPHHHHHHHHQLHYQQLH